MQSTTSISRRDRSWSYVCANEILLSLGYYINIMSEHLCRVVVVVVVYRVTRPLGVLVRSGVADLELEGELMMRCMGPFLLAASTVAVGARQISETTYGELDASERVALLDCISAYITH
jgi:hypothetical protein